MFYWCKPKFIVSSKLKVGTWEWAWWCDNEHNFERQNLTISDFFGQLLLCFNQKKNWEFFFPALNSTFFLVLTKIHQFFCITNLRGREGERWSLSQLKNNVKIICIPQMWGFHEQAKNENQTWTDESNWEFSVFLVWTQLI